MLLGGLGEVVDRVDAQRPQVGHVVGGHLLGDGGHGDAALLRLGDQLVVDVGDVDDQRHLVAAVGRGTRLMASKITGPTMWPMWLGL